MPPEADTGVANQGVVADPNAAATAAAAAAAAGAVAGTPTPWTAGLDAELLGHAQNRGWHDKSADAVAREALKAHREAETLIGLPADRVLKLPKDASDEAGWKAVYARLGTPADPKEYDFSAVKFKDGSELTPAFVDHIRNVAATSHLSKEAAVEVAKGVVAYLDSSSEGETAEKTARLAEEKAKLATEWGANLDANKYVATQTALKLGVKPEEVASLENLIGYARTMELFRSIGQKIGEDSFITNGGPNPGVMTREQAIARKAELLRDEAWAKRYTAGDATANRELQALLAIIVPQG